MVKRIKSVGEARAALCRCPRMNVVFSQFKKGMMRALDSIVGIVKEEGQDQGKGTKEIMVSFDGFKQ